MAARRWPAASAWRPAHGFAPAAGRPAHRGGSRRPAHGFEPAAGWPAHRFGPPAGRPATCSMWRTRLGARDRTSAPPARIGEGAKAPAASLRQRMGLGPAAGRSAHGLEPAGGRRVVSSRRPHGSLGLHDLRVRARRPRTGAESCRPNDHIGRWDSTTCGCGPVAGLVATTALVPRAAARLADDHKQPPPRSLGAERSRTQARDRHEPWHRRLAARPQPPPHPAAPPRAQPPPRPAVAPDSRPVPPAGERRKRPRQRWEIGGYWRGPTQRVYDAPFSGVQTSCRPYTWLSPRLDWSLCPEALDSRFSLHSSPSPSR